MKKINMSESKKRELRIVYMGTPDFAVAGLKSLLEHNYHVVGVITAPDRPAGRGQQLRESAIKQFALKNNIKVLQPTNLKAQEFVEELKSLKANLQVVVAFRMLPKVVWQMPEYGTFNLHASLLPQYRGAAPINWAIINGEEETGVTTFFIDEKIDTGAMILQEKIKIGSTTTAGELHDQLMQLGANAILSTVKQIENNTVSTTLQSEKGELKPAHKIHKDTCKIDWSWPLDKIYNHIRGLSPYPAAWTAFENGDVLTTLKIFSVEKELKDHNHPNGVLIGSKKSLKVAVADGYLNLLEIQLAGKKRMKVSQILNGLSLAENAKFC